MLFRIENTGLKRNAEWILLIPNKISEFWGNEIFSVKPFAGKGIDSGWPEKLVRCIPLYHELTVAGGLAHLGGAMKCR